MNNRIAKTLGLESIDFQSGLLFKELTVLYEELQRSLKAKEGDREIVQLCGNMSRAIAKATNLSIDVNVTSDPTTALIGPHIILPEVDRNNVLIGREYRDYVSSKESLKRIDDTNMPLRGAVNLKKSSVSGIFTAFRSEMNIPIAFVESGKYTPGELAAITLHEVGHMFTMFELISRTVVTNQVLAELSRSYANLNREERKVILTDAKRIMMLDKLDAVELSESNSVSAVSTVLVTEMINNSRDELGHDLYNMTAWEYLCDEFATRHGAGRDLGTALVKLHKSMGDIIARSSFMYFFLEAAKIMMIIGNIIIASNPATVVLLEATLPITLLLILADSRGASSYDIATDRVKRVRNQLVQELKDKSIPSARVKQLTEDINLIDDAMATMSGRRQLFDVICDFVIPSARKFRKTKQLQQELEELAVNEVFAKSAQLRAGQQTV